MIEVCSQPIVDFEINSEENGIENTLDQFQNRQNILQERVISLKALTKTLKIQISNEKTLWQNELNETVNVEKQITERQKASISSLTLNQEEYQMKLEIFKEYLFFSQTSSNLQQILKKNSYQKWLSEIENECNTELERITQSMTALKPLQEIASTWVDEYNQNDRTNYDFLKNNEIPESPENGHCLVENLEDSQNHSQHSGDITERFSLISSD